MHPRVLQVAWAKFADNGASSTLCMLQQSLLTTYTLNGQLQTVPVPASVTSLHPIPQGLLLNVSFTVMLVPVFSHRGQDSVGLDPQSTQQWTVSGQDGESTNACALNRDACLGTDNTLPAAPISL